MRNFTRPIPALILLVASAAAADQWQPKRERLAQDEGTELLSLELQIKDNEMREAALRAERDALQSKVSALLKPHVEAMRLDPGAQVKYAVINREVWIVEVPAAPVSSITK